MESVRVWSGRRDLNSHGGYPLTEAPSGSQGHRVYQFRHARIATNDKGKLLQSYPFVVGFLLNQLVLPGVLQFCREFNAVLLAPDSNLVAISQSLQNRIQIIPTAELRFEFGPKFDGSHTSVTLQSLSNQICLVDFCRAISLRLRCAWRGGRNSDAGEFLLPTARKINHVLKTSDFLIRGLEFELGCLKFLLRFLKAFLSFQQIGFAVF
jgi:hypothetical protein